MSWGFEIEEEKKEYPVAGTVTISSEEYRDLVRQTVELKMKARKEHDDWYEQMNKAKALENQLAECKDLFDTKITLYSEFLQSKGLDEEFKNFCKELKLKKMEEDE